jgi:hypothetical protein
MKLGRLVDSKDNHIGYTHWCPGCKSIHNIWTETRNSLGATWSFNGDVEKPTFNPSVRIQWESGERVKLCCHYFIKDGRIEYCSDCTHDLKGQTIPLPELPADERD